MAPSLKLTIITHPGLMTRPNSSFSNTLIFPFNRSRLIRFFHEMISINRPGIICYSFAAPPVSSSKNRFLDAEIPINFATVLAFAEAASHKGIPMHLYPKGSNPDYGVIEAQRGRTLNFTDFKDIFVPKLDKESAQNLRQKLTEMKNFHDVSYPELDKLKKNDDNLTFIGQLSVSPISSESVINLLAKGTNVVLTTESNESFLIQMTSRYTTNWDKFDITWHTTPDDSYYSCGKLNIPVVVDSSKMYYSHRSTNLMNILKTEFNEWIEKNTLCASSNPFHQHSDKKSASEHNCNFNDGEFETNSDDFVFADELKEPEKENATVAASPKSEQSTAGDKKERNSDSETSLTVEQLTNFLKEFKVQMKEELMGVVEETVKKYSLKDGAEGMSFAENEPEVHSVININDCVKSEADDSDLPKLLCTLSQIEEQLSSIENAAGGSDVASTKPNKYTHYYGVHAGHRRGRDFSSLSRRATLGILKKRMKGSVVELEPDLFAISKSGFKLKMARNVSQSFRFALFKYGKYRNSKFEVDFMPTIVPGGGLECCVKPTTKNLDKSQIDDKGLYSFFDVRFKSKERTGKFRCFLKILRNGKVCVHPLCINVRVKRFCSNSDQIDSAEEAIPGYLNTDLRSRFDENRFAGFESTSAANADIDEGISGFQEYPSSISSDSDDVDANRENDNDEGIDPGLKVPCSAFEKLQINEERSARSNFDDSDSSVSLLLDENEVRENLDDDFDLLKIPPCFIPSTDINREAVSVRVKRKISSIRKKKANETVVHSSEGMPKVREWWLPSDVNQSTGSGCSKKSETKSSAGGPQVSSVFPPKEYRPSRHEPDSYQFPRQKKETKEPISSSPAGPSSAKTESSCPYKPLYPNLESLHETKAKKPAKIPTATKETQSPVAILPEKVFEMTSNVFKTVMNSMKQPSIELKENIQKNVDETLWSIFGGGPPVVQPYAAPAPPPHAAPAPPPPSTASVPADGPSPVNTTSPSAPAPSVTTTVSDNAPLLNPPPTTHYSWSASSPETQTTISTTITEAAAAASAAAAAATAAAATATSAAAAAATPPVMTASTTASPQAQSPFASFVPPHLSPQFVVPPPSLPPFCTPPPPFVAPPLSSAPFFAPSPPSTSIYVQEMASVPAQPIPRQSTSVGTNTPEAAGMSTATMLVDPTTVPIESVPSPPRSNRRVPIIVRSSRRDSSPAQSSRPKIPATAQPVTINRQPASNPGRRSGGGQADQQTNARGIADYEYNQLEPEVRNKIFKLNEMGFSNDNYNLFLIRKYPEDLNKVVESLVNFSDF